MSQFDAIGGDALRSVVADFYDRVFADPMIGFLFAGKDKAKLIQLEWELAARMLGGAVKYTGRPIRAAHAQLPIFGGQFARRLQILRETLRDHRVPDAVRDTWLAHNEALRAHVTKDKGSECATANPVAHAAAPAQPGDAPIKLGRR